MKKTNTKTFFFLLLFPLVLGFLVGFLTQSSDYYSTLKLPSFAPPGFLFPIVWTILYLLMGISSYWIYQSNRPISKRAFQLYFIQLFVNLCWPIFFFLFGWNLFSFLWILLLLFLVILLLKYYFRISKKAFYSQIPYLVWVIFASILNLAIVILN